VKTAVVCPCHFAEFDVRTGAVLAPPATVPIKVYPVRVQGSDLQVEF
jgi:3-phenylpropionate/trans-cinnamate dioxygenase ferredoxin subunit